MLGGCGVRRECVVWVGGLSMSMSVVLCGVMWCGVVIVEVCFGVEVKESAV